MGWACRYGAWPTSPAATRRSHSVDRATASPAEPPTFDNSVAGADKAECPRSAALGMDLPQRPVRHVEHEPADRFRQSQRWRAASNRDRAAELGVEIYEGVRRSLHLLAGLGLDLG